MSDTPPIPSSPLQRFQKFIRGSQSRILQRFMTIGVDPEDEAGVRSRKFMLVAMAGLMSVGGLLWGVLLLIFGLHQQAIVPFGYIGFSVANVLVFNYTKHLPSATALQVAMSMLLPFGLQWWLGGYTASGMVCLWSPIAILGALLINKGNGLIWWVSLFIGLCVFSGLMEGRLESIRPEILTDQVSTFLLVFNLVCMVGLISGLSANNVQRDKKMRRQLYMTMDELSQSMELLGASQEEISAQSEQLEEKSLLLAKQNESLNHSIRYATRIQNAILPEPKELCGVFDSSFLLFLPRDKVSGDFYWCSEVKDCFVVVAADCTGHGVPGAFLTMLGSTLLNQIISDREELDPSVVLGNLDAQLARTLKQDQGTGVRDKVADGMDVSVVVIRPQEKKIHFAGAMQSLFHVHDGNLEEIKGNKFPVGDMSKYKAKDFTTHDVSYQKGDHIYLSSDGYKDQFGGPDNRKYMARNLRERLLQISPKPMDEQREILEREHLEWKGDLSQTDDILIMGMKF